MEVAAGFIAALVTKGRIIFLGWIAVLKDTASRAAGPQAHVCATPRILPALTAPGRAVLLIPLALFPLVYYFVSYVAHYPAPLASMLLLLASYEVRSWISRGNQNRADPTRPA